MTRKVRILVSDPIKLKNFQQRLQQGKTEFEVDYRPTLSAPELERIIGNYEGIIFRSRTCLSRKILEKSKLRFAGRAGNGLDNIDLPTAQEQGIYVVNCPGQSKRSVAELTMGLFQILSRNLLEAHSSLLEGRWNKDILIGHELYGKTLGIIGLGNIGKEVEALAHAYGMQVIVYDKYISSLNHLDTVLTYSDYLTLHLPLTDETAELLGKREIERMKNGTYVVNTSREQIFNLEALVEGVQSGKIAGYATDVFKEEPPTSDHHLLQLAREGYNVVITPHIGAQTEEAQKRIAEELARKTINFFDNETKISWKIRPFYRQVPSEYKALAVAAAIVLGIGAIALSDRHHCDQEYYDFTVHLPDMMVKTCPHRYLPGSIRNLTERE